MTMKSLLGTVSLALLLGGAASAAQAQIADRPSCGPFRRHIRRRHALRTGRRRHLRLGQQERRHRRQAAERRQQRLRLPGAARDRAVQEVVGARQQGRGDHGLGHRRYRGADRLPRAGQDPRHLRLLCRRADRSRKAPAARPSPRPTISSTARATPTRCGPMLTWAAEDWKAKGKPGKPKFVHMGANHPYPERAEGGRRSARHRARLRGAAAAGVCADARRLQRAVPEPEELRRQLRLSRQHRRLQHLGAEGLQDRRRRRPVPGQRLGHGRERRQDRRRRRRRRVFPLRTAVSWGGNAPGMKTVMEISKMSDPDRQGLSPGALHRGRLHARST